MSRSLPKNRLQDRLLRRKQDDAGVGQPNKIPKQMSTDSNVFLGQKNMNTNYKNHNKNMLNTIENQGLGTKKYGLLGSTASLKKSDNLSESEIEIESTGDNMDRNMNIIELNESTIAMIEQLLESSKTILEELSDTKIVSGAAGAKGGGIGVTPVHREQPSTLSYSRAVDSKLDRQAVKHNQSVDNAAETGINKARGSYSFQNGNSSAQQADNGAKLRDLQERKYQDQQNQEQG